MNKIFKEGYVVPVKSWCNEIEAGAIEQIDIIAKLPFVKHIAIMPDCHQGYDVPIGSVIATKNEILVSGVGVDIGCGVSLVEYAIQNLSHDTIKDIHGKIMNEIPLGTNWNKDIDYSIGYPEVCDSVIKAYHNTKSHVKQTVDDINKEVGLQLCSLGGGNHFIELQINSKNNLCVMIHSGSRNLGKIVCDYYTDVAKDLCNKYYSKSDIAFLPADSKEGKEYLEAMTYCLNFSHINRKAMHKRITNIIGSKPINTINIQHNYAAIESHFGNNYWVHRKGATNVREGITGLIPGSQGSKSYVVGYNINSEDSLHSCSHGAGRKLGRKVARKTLNLENEIKMLNDKGIIHSIKTTEDLDEATGAYKDIDFVMEQQKDLINILDTQTPIAVVKG